MDTKRDHEYLGTWDKNKAPWKTGNKFWQIRVFVTGSGLVGGWLVKKLCEMNADVIVLVRDWVPKSKLISSDLLKKIAVGEVIYLVRNFSKDFG